MSTYPFFHYSRAHQKQLCLIVNAIYQDNIRAYKVHVDNFSVKTLPILFMTFKKKRKKKPMIVYYKPFILQLTKLVYLFMYQIVGMFYCVIKLTWGHWIEPYFWSQYPVVICGPSFPN